jgi:TetR/AcrR family transcriptional regulator, cholesterol catabolism regulator
MGRREDKRDLTRQQMLTSAAELFAERGYEATSVEDIAERANLSKGTFYYHFETKEALVVELRRSMLAGTVDQTLALLAQGQPPITVLEKLLLDRAAFTQKEPELSKVFFLQRVQVILFKDEDLIVKANADGQRKMMFRAAIYELVCEAQKRGQIRSDQSPAEITGMIIAFQLHAQGAWLASDRSSSLVDKMHRWLHALLDGVGAKGYRDQSPCFTPNTQTSLQGLPTG